MDKYFKQAGSLVDENREEKDNYFEIAGSLEEPGRKDIENIGIDYFQVAGNLDDEKDLGFFRPADIFMESEKKDTQNTETGYFMPAGDLNKDINIKKIDDEKKFNNVEKKEDINDYLLTVVSGEKYPAVCALGVLTGAGRMIVDLNQLKKMVEEGYNIVSATIINEAQGLVEVEVQRYVYDEELMEKRRRF